MVASAGALVESQRALAEERGVRLVAAVEVGLPAVLADRERLARVFDNLLGNALKFTPSGGSVTLRATGEGATVRFAVEDTGAGIPPEHVTHLFDRFWQARTGKREGVGLGLAIVKGFVEAHGGLMKVESHVGAGSTFSFSLPTTAS